MKLCNMAGCRMVNSIPIEWWVLEYLVQYSSHIVEVHLRSLRFIQLHSMSVSPRLKISVSTACKLGHIVLINSAEVTAVGLGVEFLS